VDKLKAVVFKLLNGENILCLESENIIKIIMLSLHTKIFSHFPVASCNLLFYSLHTDLLNRLSHKFLYKGSIFVIRNANQ
jgi:hypothetical protein